MKTASTALVSLLNGAGGATPLCYADLYTFVLAGGGLLLYTTADFPITAANNTIWDAPKADGSGNLWYSGITWAPGLVDTEASKSTGHWKVGLDADQWSVQVSPRPVDIISGAAFPDKIGSVPWLQAARSGALDNAELIVLRAYFASMPTWPIPVKGLSPVGTITIFRGLVGTVDCSNSAAIVTVNDWKSILNQNMPRNLYQSSCRHRVFDARCGLSAGYYTGSGAAGAGSTRASIVATVAAPGGSGTYTLGTLKMTSGLNSGFSRVVSNWAGGVFSLLNPFPFDIALGDTFTVTAGCDKSTATCIAFGNLANFGGEPFIPIPEVSVG